MFNLTLLGLLRCPDDGSELSPARQEDIHEINALIANRRIVNRAGRTLDETIDAGFVRAAGDILYPVVQEIPMLLRDEGIELTQLSLVSRD